jgi:hypothetical protein
MSAHCPLVAVSEHMRHFRVLTLGRHSVQAVGVRDFRKQGESRLPTAAHGWARRRAAAAEAIDSSRPNPNTPSRADRQE